MLADKYRPKRLDEIIGQDHVVSVLRNIVAKSVKVHMLFVGSPGTGKTSTAYALSRELGWDIYEFNASDERGIQTIREKIKPLALSTGNKIILLDEADNMTEDAQQALRRIMEKSVAMFILTANREEGIIDPIKSRCLLLRFNRLDEETIYGHIVKILKLEGVRGVKGATKEEFKERMLELIRAHDNDLRSILNRIEGMIDGEKFIRFDSADKNQTYLNMASEIIKLSYNGDLRKASDFLAKMISDSRFNYAMILQNIVKAVTEMEIPEIHKLKILSKVASVEQGIKMGCSPYIQLMSMMADLMMIKYARGETNG